MGDIKTYKQSDLVLEVSPKYDPTKLDLDIWARYLDILCGDREYQKEAIKDAIIFLASGRYKTTEDLVQENYNNNNKLQGRYSSLSNYLDNLQIKNKLFANIDLATGTGKSYVIYGIAQIMLGLGLIKRVLVLCPSVTIENGLKEKFIGLAADTGLRDSIPTSAKIKNPRIIDANSTIAEGDICVENIHAVYATTGSSIEDSFKNGGEDTLVLNDESHHIFNALQSINARSTEGKNIKRWKEFLINERNNFPYILGLTGTAYVDDEYFNDVIYRYSLRQAIDDKVVKTVDYVQKDDSGNKRYERFQKIYHNHDRAKAKYGKIKPLTILITKDIKNAERLREELIGFLIEWTSSSKEDIEKKVLIVTSHTKHKNNIAMLSHVDDKHNPIEWIISVSMLTEGWDVKNVFQIVPWEDRAFNSKLLIAQVLGRGLRLPEEYKSPQPSVVVFNHDSWSKNIKNLVDEVLENETRIISSVRFKGDRNKYNFHLKHLNYTKKEHEEVFDETKKELDYSKTWDKGIKLTSQTENVDKSTVYDSLLGNEHEEIYSIVYRTKNIHDIVNKIYNGFKIRDWEGGILGLGDDEIYSKDNLPPRKKILEIIRTSMKSVGIKGDELIEENAQKVFQAFSTLFRQKSKRVVHKIIESDPYGIDTSDMNNENTGLSSFRSGKCSLYYADDYLKVAINQEQKKVLEDFLEDESFPRSASKEVNEYLFKTPQNYVITTERPERGFVESLCKKENAVNIESWVKSRDVGFYSIEYTYRVGTHQRRGSFNPDFFIKCKNEEETVILVVEIKADKDVSAENKGKYKSGKLHFEKLNLKLQEAGEKERYIFHFLSPRDYYVFFDYLTDGRLLQKQELFRCELENLLENNGDD